MCLVLLVIAVATGGISNPKIWHGNEYHCHKMQVMEKISMRVNMLTVFTLSNTMFTRIYRKMLSSGQIVAFILRLLFLWL